MPLVIIYHLEAVMKQDLYLNSFAFFQFLS